MLSNEHRGTGWEVLSGLLPDRRLPGLHRALREGGVALGAGTAVAGGFLVEWVKTFVTPESGGRWWLFAVFVLGVAVLLFGAWQVRQASRPRRVGVAVTLMDARRDLAIGADRQRDAERYAGEGTVVSFAVRGEITGGTTDAAEVDAAVGRVVESVTVAQRLTGDRVVTELVPTMPLHAAFRLGARLGYTHSPPVRVHAVSREKGYFPAVSLTVRDDRQSPLRVAPLEELRGDPTQLAVAVDPQKFRDFPEQVRAECRSRGIGWLLLLSNPDPSRTLTENTRTFSGVVDQVARAVAAVNLPQGSAHGHRTIFLTGPVALSVGLGARLATADPTRWTACTRDKARGCFESMPAGMAG